MKDGVLADRVFFTCQMIYDDDDDYYYVYNLIIINKNYGQILKCFRNIIISTISKIVRVNQIIKE